jgi:hypothetical protein
MMLGSSVNAAPVVAIFVLETWGPASGITCHSDDFLPDRIYNDGADPPAYFHFLAILRHELGKTDIVVHGVCFELGLHRAEQM